MRGLAAGVVLAGLIVAPVGWAAQATHTADQAVQQRDVKSRATRQPATRTRRSIWHLSQSDWQRYQKLKQGLGAFRSSHLDPLTMLGIHARSPAERRRFAERLARAEHHRIQQVLAFQRAYDAAYKRLYPDAQVVNAHGIDRALATSRHRAAKLGLAGHGRPAVFVDIHGCPACRHKVKTMAEHGKRFDIYVLDAHGHDQPIRAWARRVGLKPGRVRHGDITLNHAPKAAATALRGRTLPRVIPAGHRS